MFIVFKVKFCFEYKENLLKQNTNKKINVYDKKLEGDVNNYGA